jgi:hypothetical protein
VAGAAAPSAASAQGYTFLNAPMPLLGGQSDPVQHTGFTPAPVPKGDVAVPGWNRKPVPGEPQFVASLGMRAINGGMNTASSGQGYSPGSSFSDDLQRRNRSMLGGLAPTVGVQVPIDK